MHTIGILGCRFQGRSAASARSEKADFETLSMRVALEPRSGFHEAFGQQLDIETQMASAHVDLFFFLAEEIEQKRGQSAGSQDARNKLVPGAQATAAAAVRKQDDACRAFRHVNPAPQGDLAELDVLRFVVVLACCH
jgi:hypothetical protein